MRRDLIACCALLSGALIVPGGARGASVDTAARVLVSAGDNAVVRAGKKLPLKSGDEVLAGDTLHIGAASNAQLRFTDSSIVALRPNTVFRVEQYRFKANAAEDESIFSLLKGGLRTLTGLIGKANEKNYQVKTPNATIGIRGTHYALLLCEGDCRRDDGSLAENGLYGHTVDGRIVVDNGGGEETFGRNVYFFAAGDKRPAQGLVAPPPFLADALEGRQAARRAAAGESLRAGGGNLAASISQRAQALVAERRVHRAAVFRAGENDEIVDQQALFEQSARSFVFARLGDADVPNVAGGTLVLRGDAIDPVKTFTSASDRLGVVKPESTKIVGKTPGLDEFTVDPSLLASWGSFSLTRTTDGAPPARDVVHWLVAATPLRLPTTGIVSYAWVGGSVPTSLDAQGVSATGSLGAKGALTVDFAARTLSMSSLTWSMPSGASYDLAFANRPLRVDTRTDVGRIGGAVFESIIVNDVCSAGCTDGKATVAPTLFGRNAGGVGLGVATAAVLTSGAGEKTASVQVYARGVQNR